MTNNEVKEEEKGDNKGQEPLEQAVSEPGGETHREGGDKKEGEAYPPTTPQITMEDLGSTLKDATEVIKAQANQIKKMEEQLAAFNVQEFKELTAKVNDMADKMPRVIKDDKATVSGYYDFEHKTKKLVNESSELDRRQAIEAFDFLNKPL